MSLHEEAAKREELWLKYELYPDFLGDFALKELARRSPDEYQLSALFSAPAIDAILRYSCVSANAFHRGARLVSFGEGGANYRPLEEGKMFERLLALWESAGWVILSVDPGTGELVAKRNNSVAS